MHLNWVCDGEGDCDDKSDEWFCGRNVQKTRHISCCFVLFVLYFSASVT